MLKLATQSKVFDALQLEGFPEFCQLVGINTPLLSQNNLYYFHSLNDELTFLSTAIGWASLSHYNFLPQHTVQQIFNDIKNNVELAYRHPQFIEFAEKFHIPTPSSFLKFYTFKKPADKIIFLSFYNGFIGFMLNLNK